MPKQKSADPIDVVVRQLTPTQKEVMMTKTYGEKLSPYLRTAKVLERLGLIKKGRDFYIWEFYELTLLGKKVRERLFAMKHVDDPRYP